MPLNAMVRCVCRHLAVGLFAAAVSAGAVPPPFPPAVQSPFDAQVTCHLEGLGEPEPATRAEAAAALGFLRSRAAGPALAAACSDPSPAVRRSAALALGWCGSRVEVSALAACLDDDARDVRQAACVALCNLTGRSLPASGPAAAPDGAAVDWVRREVLPRLRSGRGIGPEHAEALSQPAATDLASGCSVTASSTYKGPVSALTDPDDPSFWQTKNVPFPQHVTVDLGEERTVGHVLVSQHSARFCMTDYELSFSTDGTVFESAGRIRETSPVVLPITVVPRQARFVRIASHGTLTPTYPTTFWSIQVFATPPVQRDLPALAAAARACASLGGPGDSSHLAAALEPYLTRPVTDSDGKVFVQTALRALGRTGGETAFETLVAYLDRVSLARYAAAALGELGDRRAVPHLVAAYGDYGRSLGRKGPVRLPPDDIPRFENVDRMFETPFEIAVALSRLATPDDGEALEPIALQLLANLPGDFDGMMVYEPESTQLVTAHLLELCGVRRPALAAALSLFGCEVAVEEGAGASGTSLRKLAMPAPGGCPYGAAWLSALARPGEYSDALRQLLRHDNGWVRINAAKTLMFCRTRAAGRDIAALLAASKPEAAYGYNGRYLFSTRHRGQDEYNAPSPCWREAFARALAVLGSSEHVPMLVEVLNDPGNVLEVQTAAVEALAAIGGAGARQALARACENHPFHSVRLLAREKLGPRAPALSPAADTVPSPRPVPPQQPGHSPGPHSTASPSAYVFVRGPNAMPNDFSIDRWRQTYSTTDAGPEYRVGHSLRALQLREGGPRARLLLDAGDGWIGGCEVSWDGQRIIFARRGGDDDPWWHLCEIHADGTGLRQLTTGPYHDVQPAYLPDGRIVFSTTRIGARDEYHGYPATGLAVVQPDGTGLECIGFNVGRDDEPAVLPDGRIAFSRLELFYSRLKTERTVHAVFPDGTGDVTLYGPERRAFWRAVTQASGERWWGEAPPRHRVLRLTQPQPVGPGRVVCATTAGLTVIGPGRYLERVVPRDGNKAVTSPFPNPDGTIVCAATERMVDRSKIDLGLYLCDPDSGRLTLLYNTPDAAEFEPRPLVPRERPPVLAARRRAGETTGTLICDSVFRTRDPRVRTYGRLLRLVEGVPPVGRHHTHTSSAGEAWKNHTGTLGRVWATLPLAPDGSFHVTVPADRLFHCQVLDTDRRVVGNQLIWMYCRPGETRSCVGCHEAGDEPPSPVRQGFSQASTQPPIRCAPNGGELRYRAKLWQKGVLPDEGEERTRTVRAINILGRY